MVLTPCSVFYHAGTAAGPRYQAAALVELRHRPHTLRGHEHGAQVQHGLGAARLAAAGPGGGQPHAHTVDYIHRCVGTVWDLRCITAGVRYTPWAAYKLCAARMPELQQDSAATSAVGTRGPSAIDIFLAKSVLLICVYCCFVQDTDRIMWTPTSAAAGTSRRVPATTSVPITATSL
jgi:hypothetical protein